MTTNWSLDRRNCEGASFLDDSVKFEAHLMRRDRPWLYIGQLLSRAKEKILLTALLDTMMIGILCTIAVFKLTGPISSWSGGMVGLFLQKDTSYLLVLRFDISRVRPCERGRVSTWGSPNMSFIAFKAAFSSVSNPWEIFSRPSQRVLFCEATGAYSNARQGNTMLKPEKAWSLVTVLKCWSLPMESIECVIHRGT